MRSFGAAVHFITRTIGAVPYVTASFFGSKIGRFRTKRRCGRPGVPEFFPIFGGKKCADYGFEIRAERIAQALGNR